MLVGDTRISLWVSIISVLWISIILGGCHETNPSPSRSQDTTKEPTEQRVASLDSSVSSDQVHSTLKSRDSKVKRVISLAPSHTEWMFALDAQSLLVGRTDRCDHPSEVSQVPSIGTLFPPQFERILSRAPTDVLMIDGHLGLKAQLRKLGVRVHEIQPHSLSEIFSQVGELGDLLSQSKKAHAWLTQARARIKGLQVPKRRPKVFVEIWNTPLTAAGSKSFMGDLVHVAGGDIYPKDLGAWPTVSLERLITYNPEVILVSTKALYHELLTSPTKPWRAVSAVQTRQIYLLEGRLTRPGPRIIDDVVWLNKLLSHTSQAEWGAR